MPEMPELKPCPFCGEKAIVQKESSGHKGNGEYTASFFIGCESCNVGFSCESTFVLDCGEVKFIHNGYEEAKELWNTRANETVCRSLQTPMPLQEVLEKSKHINDNVIWLEQPDEDGDNCVVPAFVSNFSQYGYDESSIPLHLCAKEAKNNCTPEK